MLKLRVTKKAWRDLVAIGRYTKEEWGIVQRDQYLKELDARFMWLLKNPTVGKERSEIKEGYRSFKQGSHVIFYLHDEKHLDIIGILHEHMDFERHL